VALRAPKPFTVFASGVSLRRRVAYSLAIVRLILVPVILLAIYYLFAMGRILDRIVSVYAPMATMAQSASIEMLDARRAEKNYFLLHNPEDLEAHQEAVAKLDQAISSCAVLQPEERPTLDLMQAQLDLYKQRFQQVVRHMGQPVQTPVDRIQEVVRAYEKDLNDLLKRAGTYSRGQLVEELRGRVGSFDAQITTTLATEDPELRQATNDLRTSSDEILRLSGELEKRSWGRVQRSHEEAGVLIRRAEWVLIIVSSLTILLSVWVSLILPRRVVRPLMDLKAAVDHAAAGNYEVEFDLKGEAEVVQLAESVRNLIAHVRDKKNGADK
jgi:CHASE3 domain sensor protein